MIRIRGRGLLVWMALLCSLLLPVTAVRGMNAEMRAHQMEALGCGMPDHCNMPNCHCPCCQPARSQMTGCNCSGGFMPYLSTGGTIIYDRQAVSHRLDLVAPVFKTFTTDIFHPPELCLS